MFKFKTRGRFARASLFASLILLLSAFAAAAFAAPETDGSASAKPAGYDIYVYFDESGRLQNTRDLKGERAVATRAVQSTIDALLKTHILPSVTQVQMQSFGSLGLGSVQGGGPRDEASSGRWRDDLNSYSRAINPNNHDRVSFDTDFTPVLDSAARAVKQSTDKGRVPILMFASDFVHDALTRRPPRGRNCSSDDLSLPSDRLNTLKDAIDAAGRSGFVARTVILAVPYNPPPTPTDPTRNDFAATKCRFDFGERAGYRNSRELGTRMSGGKVVFRELSDLADVDQKPEKAEEIAAQIEPAPVVRVAPALTGASLQRSGDQSSLVFSLSLPATAAGVNLTNLTVSSRAGVVIRRSQTDRIDKAGVTRTLTVPLSQDEFARISASPGPKLVLQGGYENSRESWTSTEADVVVERLAPLSVDVAAGGPSLFMDTSGNKTENDAPIEIRGLAVSNPSDLARAVAEIQIIDGEADDAPVRISSPTADRIPANARGFKLPGLQIDLDTFHKIAAKRDPRIGVIGDRSEDMGHAAAYVPLRNTAPRGQLRVTRARLIDVRSDGIEVETEIRNDGRVTASINAFQLQAADPTVAPSTKLNALDIKPGESKTLKIPFPISDVTKYVNSGASKMVLRVLRGGEISPNSPSTRGAEDGKRDAPLEFDVDARWMSDQLTTETVEVVSLATDEATLRVGVRNARPDPFQASVAGVRAAPRGGVAPERPLLFDAPLSINAGEVGTGTVTIRDPDAITRLLGRVVDVAPYENRDDGSPDPQFAQRSKSVVLTRITLDILPDSVGLMVGRERPEGGRPESAFAKAILTGQVRVSAVVPPSSADMLDKATLHVELVNQADVVSRGEEAKTTIGRLRPKDGDPNGPLQPFDFKISRTSADQATLDDRFSALETYLSAAFIRARLEWPPESGALRSDVPSKKVLIQNVIKPTVLGYSRISSEIFKARYDYVGLIFGAIFWGCVAVFTILFYYHFVKKVGIFAATINFFDLWSSVFSVIEILSGWYSRSIFEYMFKKGLSGNLVSVALFGLTMSSIFGLYYFRLDKNKSNDITFPLERAVIRDKLRSFCLISLVIFGVLFVAFEIL